MNVGSRIQRMCNAKINDDPLTHSTANWPPSTMLYVNLGVICKWLNTMFDVYSSTYVLNARTRYPKHDKYHKAYRAKGEPKNETNTRTQWESDEKKTIQPSTEQQIKLTEKQLWYIVINKRRKGVRTIANKINKKNCNMEKEQKKTHTHRTVTERTKIKKNYVAHKMFKTNNRQR